MFFLSKKFIYGLLICAALQLTFSVQAITIYSHGYGETGPSDTQYSVEGTYDPNAKGPIYTDSDSFYTRPAVINLLNYLHMQVVVQGNDSVNLVGRSCGAGIIINALAKLIEYDNKKSYFEGSAITSKRDADRILESLNNGRLELTCPLLSLEKTVVVDRVSKAAANLSLSWLFGSNYYKKVNNLCSSSIDRTIVSRIFKDYDVNHDKPIDVLHLLSGKITCPKKSFLVNCGLLHLKVPSVSNEGSKKDCKIRPVFLMDYLY